MDSKANRKWNKNEHRKRPSKVQLAKKKFREEKYKGLKKAAHDKRQEKLMHEYKKVLRKENANLKQWKSKVSQIYNENDSDKPTETSSQHHQRKEKFAKKNEGAKLSKFHKAELKWKSKKEEKRKKVQIAQQKESERSDALAEYQKKKHKTHKKIAKRNYKGQPNMASRMDLLLQKIESNK